jgi:hypothetical protein
MSIEHLGIAIVKVLLLTYLLVGAAALIIVRRRRMRIATDEFMRTDPSELASKYTRSGRPGYEASIRGVTSHTPLPDWAYHDGGHQHPDDGSHPGDREASR